MDNLSLFILRGVRFLQLQLFWIRDVLCLCYGNACLQRAFGGDVNHPSFICFYSRCIENLNGKFIFSHLAQVLFLIGAGLVLLLYKVLYDKSIINKVFKTLLIILFIKSAIDTPSTRRKSIINKVLRGVTHVCHHCIFYCKIPN